MSMLQEFFVFLSDYFQEPGQTADPEALKQRMVDEGYEDVTAYDVKEAISLMYDEGDVFTNDQSSVLEAYTGGNVVDQSFNASNLGNVTAGGVAASGGSIASGGTSTSASAGSSGSGSSGSGGPSAPAAHHAPASYTPPPPPPMDPHEGYTDLDAAVEQIVYVTNITNNTTNNTTNIDDRDTFEDNDTIVDNSIDQNILAGGNVNQDFDNVTQGDNSIANTGEVTDANLVAGDNVGGVLADNIADATIATGDVGGSVTGDINDSEVVGGDNAGIVGDTQGAAVVGDDNETTSLVNSDHNAVGDGAEANDINATNVAFGDGSTAVNESAGAAVGQGATAFNVGHDLDGVVSTGEGDVLAQADVAAANFGDGGGDVSGISDSQVGAAAFGDGAGPVDGVIDEEQVDVDIDNSTVTGLQAGGEGNTNTTDIDNSQDITNVTADVDVTENNTVQISQSDNITANEGFIDTDTDTNTDAVVEEIEVDPLDPA